MALNSVGVASERSQNMSMLYHFFAPFSWNFVVMITGCAHQFFPEGNTSLTNVLPALYVVRENLSTWGPSGVSSTKLCASLHAGDCPFTPGHSLCWQIAHIPYTEPSM